jgi:hypothetical protein
MTELGAVLEQLKQERKRAAGGSDCGSEQDDRTFTPVIEIRKPRKAPPIGCRQRAHRSSAKSALGEGAGEGEEVILKMSNSVQPLFRAGAWFRPLSFLPGPNFDHSAVGRFLA